MDSRKITISVLFASLLGKIMEALGLDSPVYALSRDGKNIMYVIVPAKSGPSPLLFGGTEAEIFFESREAAAKKAVLFFVRNYGMSIHDVNLEQVERLRCCRYLYLLKRHELECLENNVDKTESKSVAGNISDGPFPMIVRLDFIELLRTIVAKMNVSVTPIDTVAHGNQLFSAWFSFVSSRCEGNRDYIGGEKKSTVSDAKQSLVEKAIHSLMTCYDFTIADVSAEELSVQVWKQQEVATWQLRSVGHADAITTQPILVEQELLTPRGKRFIIPAHSDAPLPPKKRRMTRLVHHTPLLVHQPVTIPHSVVAEELDALFRQLND